MLSGHEEGVGGGGGNGNELNVMVAGDPDLSNQCFGEHDVEVVLEGKWSYLPKNS